MSLKLDKAIDADLVTDDKGRAWTVTRYRNLRKYSARTKCGRVVTAGNYTALLYAIIGD